MNLLARREHSRCELVQKLSASVDHQDMLETVLDDLVSKGYLSDQRFVLSYVRSRKQKGFGPLKISLELREKGVLEVLIRDYLYCAEIDWYAEALFVKQKKFGCGVVSDLKEKAKQMRFLIQRGFAVECCQYALSTNTP
jgi:regulatory protein